MAWSKDVWCVLSVIKFSDDLPPFVVLSIHRNKAEAQELVNRLSDSERWPTTTRLMKYTRYIRDLKRGDVLCCREIDMIINYFERDAGSNDIRKEFRKVNQPDIFS